MKRNDINIPPCCHSMHAVFLHNMTEVHGDSFNELWMEAAVMYSQPTHSYAGNMNASSSAKAIRDALVKYYT